MVEYFHLIEPYLSSAWGLRVIGLLMASLAIFLYLRRSRAMRIVTVIDGDTVMAVDQAGKHRKLRIRGIDCPELGQRYSFEAKEFAEELVLGKWATINLYGRDKYRRSVARVRIGRIDLARELVTRGLAFPLKGSGFGMAAMGARMTGKGVWGRLGQPRPWESASRDSPLQRTLNGSKYWREFRRGQLKAKRNRQKSQF